MQSEIIRQFSLPWYVKDKTFADASKAIEAKFKDREDKASLDTKQELLERLANAQEHIKSLNNIDNPQGQQMMWGGYDSGNSGGSDASGGSGALQGVLGGASKAAGNYLLKQGNDSVIANKNPEVNAGIDAAKDIVAGVTGPWGALFRGIQKLGQGAGDAIGGNAGAGVADAFSPEESTAYGLIGRDYEGNKIPWLHRGKYTVPILGGILANRDKKKAMNNAAHTNTLRANLQYKESGFGKTGPDVNQEEGMYAMYGGKMAYGGKKMEYGGVDPYLQSIFNMAKKGQIGFGQPENPDKMPPDGYVADDIMKGFQDPVNPDKAYSEGAGLDKEVAIQTGLNKTFNKSKDFLGNHYGDIMGYAPLIGNLTDKIKQIPTSVGSRLIGQYRPSYYDLERDRNMINQTNIQGQASAGSAGSISAYNNLMGAGRMAKLKALSQSAGQAYAHNAQEDRFAFQTGQQKDMFNAQLDEKLIERRDANSAAYEQAKSDRRRQIFEDIGNIGREESNKRLVKEMFGYKWNGKYWVDRKTGDRVDDETANALMDNIMNFYKGDTTKKMYGGYLRKGKKRK